MNNKNKACGTMAPTREVNYENRTFISRNELFVNALSELAGSLVELTDMMRDGQHRIDWHAERTAERIVKAGKIIEILRRMK